MFVLENVQTHVKKKYNSFDKDFGMTTEVVANVWKTNAFNVVKFIYEKCVNNYFVQ